MRQEQQKSLDAMRARALAIPMPDAHRETWADGFNALPAMKHFGACLNLLDSHLVHVTLADLEEHHRGGLGTKAVNGAVIAGMFDCALGVAGVMQFPNRRSGTVELSIKLLRAVVGSPLDFYAGAVKTSSSIAFVESELFSGGRLCAIATGMVAVASDKDLTSAP